MRQLTEYQMIELLETLCAKAESEGLQIGFAKDFFDGGEWLLCLQELRGFSSNNEKRRFLEENDGNIGALVAYFENALGTTISDHFNSIR